MDRGSMFGDVRYVFADLPSEFHPTACVQQKKVAEESRQNGSNSSPILVSEGCKIQLKVKDRRPAPRVGTMVL